MSDYLLWPDALKRKGKRNIERLPFAIASVQYRKKLDEKRGKSKRTERKGIKKKREEIKARKLSTTITACCNIPNLKGQKTKIY